MGRNGPTKDPTVADVSEGIPHVNSQPTALQLPRCVLSQAAVGATHATVEPTTLAQRTGVCIIWSQHLER